MERALMLYRTSEITIELGKTICGTRIDILYLSPKGDSRLDQPFVLFKIAEKMRSKIGIL